MKGRCCPEPLGERAREECDRQKGGTCRDKQCARVLHFANTGMALSHQGLPALEINKLSGKRKNAFPISSLAFSCKQSIYSYILHPVYFWHFLCQHLGQRILAMVTIAEMAHLSILLLCFLWYVSQNNERPQFKLSPETALISVPKQAAASDVNCWWQKESQTVTTKSPGICFLLLDTWYSLCTNRVAAGLFFSF